MVRPLLARSLAWVDTTSERAEEPQANRSEIEIHREGRIAQQKAASTTTRCRSRARATVGI